MLPIGSIFFPLKVAPMRIENNFKGHLILKLEKLNYINMSGICLRINNHISFISLHIFEFSSKSNGSIYYLKTVLLDL